MFGRGTDILWRISDFSGRPELAVAIWWVMAIGTFVAWLAVGAMTDALGDG